jgi:hypothetical protein
MLLNESHSEIESICKKYLIQSYTINDDGSVDVIGNVRLDSLKLTELPLKFNKVSGNFYCQSNKLTTLKGCPKYVGGHFHCSRNKLTSLEGGPKIVEMSYDCMDNQLTTLKGCPEKIGSGFHAGSNKLTEMDFCPKECRVANFSNNYNLISIKKFPEKCMRVDFSWTKLLSLKGLENVEGLEEVYVSNSPLVSIFGGRIKDISMIKHFISFKVVDGDTININRLKYFQSIYTEILIRDVSLKAWYKLK